MNLLLLLFTVYIPTRLIQANISVPISAASGDKVFLTDCEAFPRNDNFLPFKVKGRKDAHLRLLPQKRTTKEPIIQIAIAAWDNWKSIINKGSGLNNIVSEYNKWGLLDENQFRDFWVGWENGHIQVGTGNEVYVNTFMEWQESCYFAVNDIEISGMHTSVLDWIFPFEATIMPFVVKCPLNEGFFKIIDNCPEFEVIKSKEAGSISECGIHCKSYNSCRGFVFSFHTNTCDLVTDNAVGSVIQTVYKMKT
ncbi:uncharacterized protein [Mytilus edulis]|uniref:uncharacterized protein n=1 Tax=Mytilus edulis TaxID=6550 RepID=UPI0039F1414E